MSQMIVAASPSADFHGSPLVRTDPLHLDATTFRTLFIAQRPSLGLWRAAEIAALREQSLERPILDLGCGDGFVTAQTLRRVDIGIDPDATALERAARRGLYARLETAPVERAAIPAGSVQTVLSNSVLEHIPHVDGALHAIARLLRPGGWLVATMPTEALSSSLLLPAAPYAAWRNHRFAHRNLWTTAQWTARLQAAGLEVEVVRPYLRPSLVRAWDTLELLQQVWIGRERLVGRLWRRIPPAGLDRLAAFASRLDLSASDPAGGRLIVARKRRL